MAQLGFGRVWVVWVPEYFGTERQLTLSTTCYTSERAARQAARECGGKAERFDSRIHGGLTVCV